VTIGESGFGPRWGTQGKGRHTPSIQLDMAQQRSSVIAGRKTFRRRVIRSSRNDGNAGPPMRKERMGCFFSFSVGEHGIEAAGRESRTTCWGDHNGQLPLSAAWARDKRFSSKRAGPDGAKRLHRGPHGPRAGELDVIKAIAGKGEESAGKHWWKAHLPRPRGDVVVIVCR